MREWLIRKNHFILCLLFLLVFGALPSFAQNRTITGTLFDKQTNEPLIGASVVIKGTSIGTAADIDGKFSLEVSDPNAILVCRFIGYNSLEYPLNGQTAVSISLSPDTEVLDEVVVIGYGTMRKSDLTGSLSSVKGEKITEYTVPNAIMALQGRAPGVVLSNNTGAPDGNFSIRIRGTNSIKGDNTPLYIIDGFPASPTTVSPHDVASVEVLKDASATAIYGSRGANGVILITTKKGKEGKSSVSFNATVGFQNMLNKVEMMDATEWATLINEQRLNDYNKEYFTADEIAKFGKGTDWQSEVYRTSPVQDYNLSISGGNNKTHFVTSGNVLLNDAMVKDAFYRKYNFRINLDHKISETLSLSLNSAYTHTSKNNKQSGGGNRGSTLISSAISAPPTLTPYNEDGSYSLLYDQYPFLASSLKNPVNLINSTTHTVKANMTYVNAAFVFQPIKEVSFRSTFGVQNNDYRTDTYVSSKNLYGKSSASISSNEQMTIVNENTVSYNKTFKENHKIDAVAGFTYQQAELTDLSASGLGFISDAAMTHDLGSASDFGVPSTSYSKWALMSYLGRFNYSYKGRYMATVSFRSDGSSRYSEGNKWGYFPSGALAWRISDEKFLRDVKEISDLRLRVGYGETGSTSIDPYTTMNMLTQGKTVLGGELHTYYSPKTNLPTPLKWETTAQFNLGLDLGLFAQKLRITADFYKKTTRDLLSTVNLPVSSGYTTTIQNIGKIGNTGFEFLIDGDILSTKDWSLNASFNIAFNKNKVISLYEGTDIEGSNIMLAYISDYISLIREGEPLGIFYTYKEDGYEDNGDIRYQDLNPDGKINVNDKVKTGDPHPDFTYGITADLRYKDFDLSLLFVGSQGNDLFNISETANLDFVSGLNVRREVLYSHWKASNTAEQNQMAKYPRLSSTLPLKFSDRYIEDGSYLRLKNISLGYNIPIKKLNKGSWVKGLKVYVSGQNLLTFTKYSGADPEVNSYGGGNSINLGYDYLSYPNSKVYTFGIKADF